MKTYRIHNIESGAFLGEYKAETEAEALDIMAQNAGYADYQDLLRNVPGSSQDELQVQEVNNE